MPKEGNGMPRRLPTTLLVSICATIALGLTGAASAAAATHTVNDPADAGDATVGDGACDANLDTDPEPECTLRAAIEEANHDPTGDADGIAFAPGLGQIDPTTAPFSVTGPVFIDGNGSSGAGATVIDGGGARQLFIVAGSAAPTTFKDIRLQNGLVDSGGGAAIRTDAANTSLNNVVVTSNAMSGLTSDAHGAGVFNTSTATLLVTGSQITDNTITTAPTFEATGAGIASAGPLNIIGSVISGNRIADGGGTSAQGGGIRADGLFAIDRSTVADNHVNGVGAEGAGIFNGSNDPAMARAIRNTTISGNDAGTSPVGAGGAQIGGDATLTNVTFADNAGGSGGLGKDLFAYGPETVVTAQNSIFASTTGCGVDGGADIAPAIPGHNIDVGTSCTLGDIDGNMENEDPMLQTGLIEFGGGQKLHIALFGSPAIDAADPACGGDIGIDQRGKDRPQGTVCDIGAYERDYRLLNASKTGQGTVTAMGINCGGDCSESLLDGTPGIVLTATPAAGSQFGSWSVGSCDSTAGNQCTVNLSNDRMVTANFSPIPTGGGGTTTQPATTPKKCKQGQKLKKGKCVKKKCKKGQKLKKGKCVQKKRKKR